MWRRSRRQSILTRGKGAGRNRCGGGREHGVRLLDRVVAEEEQRREAFGLAEAHREWKRTASEVDDAAETAICAYPCRTAEEGNRKADYLQTGPGISDEFQDEQVNALIEIAARLTSPATVAPSPSAAGLSLGGAATCLLIQGDSSDRLACTEPSANGHRDQCPSTSRVGAPNRTVKERVPRPLPSIFVWRTLRPSIVLKAWPRLECRRSSPIRKT